MCKIDDCFIIETGYWINKNKNIFKRNDFVPYNLLNVVTKKRNNFGVFKTTFRYDNEDQDNAHLYGDFYLDFDSDNFELVRQDALKALSYLKIVFNMRLLDEQVQIYFSGNKGVHIIVPGEVLGITPRKDLNEVFKTIAEAISQYTTNKTIDLKIYDKKRLFRIPNSKHEKTGLHKVEIKLDELRYDSEQTIRNKAIEPRFTYVLDKKYDLCKEASKMYETFIERTQVRLNDFKNIKSNGTLKYTPPCILKILEDGAMEGQRNHTIAILASFFKSNGKNLDEALEIIERWNGEKCTKPTPIPELRKTTRSLYSTDKSFGCSSIKALELCVSEECRFKK